MFILWLVVFALANGVRLSLIDAGAALHFEHLRAAGGLAHHALRPADAAGLAFFALLFVVVSWNVRRELLTAVAVLRARIGVFGCAVVLAVLFGTVALPTPQIVEFGLDVVLSTLIRLSLIGLTFLTVRDLPSALHDKLARLLDRIVDGVGKGLPLYCALFSFVASALLAWFSYQRVPHIPDEVAYLFQARYFAHGALSAPAPPVTRAFEVYLVSCEAGRCTSPFPPGWPMILALGVLVHAAWLVNPLLGACNVLLLYLFARELWDVKVARVATLLLTVSPWHLLMSMSFMSHVSSLTCALCAALCVARSYRTGSSWYCWPGGVAIGLVSLSRPLEAMVVSALLGLAALFARGKSFRFAPVVALGLATVAVAALNAPYNRAITGNPKLFPVTKYMDAYWGKGMNDLGFGPNRNIRLNGLDPFPGHGLRDVLVNSQICSSQLQTELFGWGAGSLWLALGLYLLGRARKLDAWLVLWVFAVIASQSLYWFSGGPDFGARYWYTAIIPLVIASARGLLELDELARAAAVQRRRPWSSAVLLMSVTALVLFIPWRALDKYYHFRTLQPGMRELLASRDFGKSLLVVRGNERPDYASAINETPIDPQSDGTLIFWGRDADTERQVLGAYPDRPAYIIDGPSRAGGVYRVVAGPITPSAPAR